MSTPVRIITFAIENWNHILEVAILTFGGALLLLGAALKAALMWPGDEPDKWLQKQIDRLQAWKDWLSQFSRKKPETEKD